MGTKLMAQTTTVCDTGTKNTIEKIRKRHGFKSNATVIRAAVKLLEKLDNEFEQPARAGEVMQVAETCSLVIKSDISIR